jgi:predicted oxidoreductase
VTLVDRDTPERLGGLALWAFGGMALVDTPLQRRMKIQDSPDIALRDWIRFGELGEQDRLPRSGRATTSNTRAPRSTTG